MIAIAGVWIVLLLLAGGIALDRVLTSAVTRNFDAQLNYALNAMIASAEMGPDGEVRFNRPLGDQRFLEPYSGLYWQVSAPRAEPFRSRSLWDRALEVGAPHVDTAAHSYDSDQFATEPLRIMERDAQLPGDTRQWRFAVAETRTGLDAQIRVLRETLIYSFCALGLGLMVLAALQATLGLWPLRQVRRALVAVRSGETARVPSTFPPEIAPLVDEINELLDHAEQQANAARMHAGNLAHALKTPMTVIINDAMADSPALTDTVMRETGVMRRQIDHHLARARALGRRSAAHIRTEVWPSLEAVERAVERLYPDVTIDLTGLRTAAVRGERQDLDEMLGNLIENAAKYGGGRVFVTVSAAADMVEVLVEDDGPGIPASARQEIFERGTRLDTDKPGTGLGLAIVQDVARIYGGDIRLDESEDLGGLAATLLLPAAPPPPAAGRG
jgi:signal transduction histidine kinase